MQVLLTHAVHSLQAFTLTGFAAVKWALPKVSQIVYYDGQFNDARLNVALACTAALAGATIVNHAKVTKLLKVRAPCRS